MEKLLLWWTKDTGAKTNKERSIGSDSSDVPVISTPIIFIIVAS